MIFRLTQALNARIKAGALETLPLHENPLLDWSAQLFPVGRSRFILLSNTASLLSVVVPGRGVTSRDRFRELAFDVVRKSVDRNTRGFIARSLLPADAGESARYARALNRSVSGSMTELVRQAEVWLGEGMLPLPEVGDRLNDTLLSALAAGTSHGYRKPSEAFGEMVSGAGPNTGRRPT